MSETRVGDIYTALKTRVVGFGIRPGDRLNEVALARGLGVSRTPLREALNRLTAERLVAFRPGEGFFCRALDPQGIFDLYELRAVIEAAAVRLACARASDAELEALHAELRATGLQTTGLTVAEAVARDEAFHLGIARLSGNAALLTQLRMINDQIRFIRWVGVQDRIAASKAEHLAVMTALLERGAKQAEAMLSAHIALRMDQVVAAVKEGLSNIYMTGPEALAGRVIEEA